MIGALVVLVLGMAVVEVRCDKKDAEERRWVIGQLKDLIEDRRSFLAGGVDGYEGVYENGDGIYLDDIKALEYAVKVLEEGL